MFIKKLFPVYWRYLLANYVRCFLFVQLCFIALLLVLSAKDIFLFASVRANLLDCLLFASIQIPYILPLTIPFSLLFSSIQLLYKLGHTKELSAFRSLGLSLHKLFAPIIIFLAFIFLTSLLIISEFTPYCLQMSKKMLYESTSKNPLALLKRKDLLKYPDLYLSSEEINDHHLKNILIVHRDPGKNNLSLLLAKDLVSDGEHLFGSDICGISYISNKDSDSMLFIENQQKMVLSKDAFIKNLKKNKLKKSLFTLPMRSLLINQKKDTKKYTATELEIFRRFSLALLAISFPLIGLTIDLEIFRKKLLLILSACFITLVFHFSAKHFDSSILIAFLAYIAPSLLLISYSIFYFYRNALRIR